MSRLGQQVFFARKRSALRSGSSRMLVTKALSQDVMVLANTFKFYLPTFKIYLPTFTNYLPTFEIYRPTFMIYHPTYEFYRHTPAKEQKKIHTQTVCESFVAQSLLHSTNTHSIHPQTFVL
ncbi:hypothetical protein CWD94_19585 [Lysinibacillus xylanilyticus]|uniref:Uncharacterized protein n=1 Tax=Lysinibacillus xylanilyticus TaxID=582475 RepID=A0A2M9Q1Y5_9BACI|nr:hypothetical protein CWD94_19585 [Lysinibacillus xylanilyticus]